MMTRASRSRLRLHVCGAVALLWAMPAMAQANGDPGGSLAGKVAADKQQAGEHKDDQDKGGQDKGGQDKSGANAMGKGTSGGTGGGTAPKGGSNALSGSGKTQ